MIFRSAKAVFGLLLGLAFVPPGVAGAQQMDAVTIAAQTDPARVESGSVQAVVTAVITESMVVEFPAPLTLGAPKTSGQAAAKLVFANSAEQPNVRADGNIELSTSIAIRGMPNQAFAVSVPGTTRLDGARHYAGLAVITHDAGSTPRIGPRGDTKFVVAAIIDYAKTMPASSYTGKLDVIVSHN